MSRLDDVTDVLVRLASPTAAAERWPGVGGDDDAGTVVTLGSARRRRRKRRGGRARSEGGGRIGDDSVSLLSDGGSPMPFRSPQLRPVRTAGIPEHLWEEEEGRGGEDEGEGRASTGRRSLPPLEPPDKTNRNDCNMDAENENKSNDEGTDEGTDEGIDEEEEADNENDDAICKEGGNFMHNSVDEDKGNEDCIFSRDASESAKGSAEAADGTREDASNDSAKDAVETPCEFLDGVSADFSVEGSMDSADARGGGDASEELSIYSADNSSAASEGDDDNDLSHLVEDVHDAIDGLIRDVQHDLSMSAGVDLGLGCSQHEDEATCGNGEGDSKGDGDCGGFDECIGGDNEENGTEGTSPSCLFCRDGEALSPIPHNADPSAPAALALHRAAAVLAERGQVASVLASLVDDIEASHQLSDRLRADAELARLRAEMDQAHRALTEGRVVRQDDERRRIVVADRLLSELVRLASKLSEADRSGEEMAGRFGKEVDELKQRLTESEVKLAELVVERDDALAAVSSLETDGPTKHGGVLGTAAPDIRDGDGTHSDGGASPSQPAGASSGEVCAPVSTKFDHGPRQGENKDSRPYLASLPNSILGKIFLFLSPEEIVSVAEVNPLFFSKVDSIFLQDNGVDGEDSGGYRTEATSGGAVSLPIAPESDTNGALSTPASLSLSVGDDKPGAESNRTSVIDTFSKLLSPVKDRRTEISTKRSNIEALDGSTATSEQLSLRMFTTETRDKIASKLSGAELSAIVTMGNKLRQLEGELEQSIADNEDLRTKLKGIEDVKDFLVSKLKDVETTNRAIQEEKDLTAMRQSASDQEVIGYLDQQVLQYESRNVQLTKERDSLSKHIKDGNIKITFLEDSLQCAREKFITADQDWKRERKTLVKEVRRLQRHELVHEAEKKGIEAKNLKFEHFRSTQFHFTK